MLTELTRFMYKIFSINSADLFVMVLRFGGSLYSH